MKLDTNELCIGDFHPTAPKDINLEYLYRIWSFKCCLCEWKRTDSWSLFIRPKLSSKNYIKWTITKDTSLNIINDLALMPVNVAFNSGYDWRTKKEWLDYERYYMDKVKPTPL